MNLTLLTLFTTVLLLVHCHPEYKYKKLVLLLVFPKAMLLFKECLAQSQKTSLASLQ